MHPVGPTPGGTPDWITAPVGSHGSEVTGWRFDLAQARGERRGLMLAFASPDALAPDERTLLAGYLALAGVVGSDVPGSAVLLDRDEISRCIHDLRNGLNSLLMNVAVLTVKLPDDERRGRFATQVQVDGERCTALLQALSDATRPPDAPLAR